MGRYFLWDDSTMALSLGGVSIVEVVREKVGCEAEDHGAEVDAVHAGAAPGLLHDVQYSTVQYSTVQYSTVQYSAVQYSTVQYRR